MNVACNYSETTDIILINVCTCYLVTVERLPYTSAVVCKNVAAHI